jgi:raffinose/stachyose/melibiose transport system permease protein
MNDERFYPLVTCSAFYLLPFALNDWWETLMVQRSSIANRMTSSLALLALSGLLLLMLFPLVMITITSLKSEQEYYANGPLSLPQSFRLEGIVTTWKNTDYTTKLVNSTLISISTALLAGVLALFNAFALGIGKIKGRTVVLIFFLMAITLPAEALVYPLYYFFKLVGLYDTRLSVVLITATLHSAFGTYLLTSVFSTFPTDLLDAAKIDGCNKIQLLARIVVPISLPTLSVLFVFFFIWTWNDFFMPLIFLISNAKQTVPLALIMAQGERNAIITAQSTAALLGILPCIIFFLLFQRTLTQGITAGSMK